MFPWLSQYGTFSVCDFAKVLSFTLIKAWELLKHSLNEIQILQDEVLKNTHQELLLELECRLWGDKKNTNNLVQY